MTDWPTWFSGFFAGAGLACLANAISIRLKSWWPLNAIMMLGIIIASFIIQRAT